MFAAFAFVSFSTGLAGPLLGLLHDEFHVSFASIGLLTGMQALGRGLATIPAGRLADRYPPGVLVSAAALLMAVGSVVVATAPVFSVLVGGMAITGVAMAFVFTAGMTHLVRVSAPAVRGRTIGLAMAGWGFGALLAPMTSGFLANEFGWRTVFMFAGMVSVLAMLIGRSVRGSSTHTSGWRPGPFPERWTMGLTWILVPVVAVSALTWGSGSTILRVVVPLYGSEGANLDPVLIGRWLTLFATLGFAVMLISGTVLDRLGRLTALWLTAASGAIGGLILLMPLGTVPFLLFGCATAAIGFSGPLIPVLVSDRSEPQHVGRSMGVVQFLTDLVNLLLPLLIGLLLDASGFGAVGIYFVVALPMAGLVGMRLIASGSIPRSNGSSGPSHTGPGSSTSMT